jgi:hypothetical protein
MAFYTSKIILYTSFLKYSRKIRGWSIICHSFHCNPFRIYEYSASFYTLRILVKHSYQLIYVNLIASSDLCATFRDNVDCLLQPKIDCANRSRAT